MSENKNIVDVVVVGSGAGAMTAAIKAHDEGLSVLVIEKSNAYGGTSAMSGGGIWIPNHGKPSAVEDCPEDAWQYTRGLVEECVSDERLKAYLERGAEMLRYMEANTRLAFEPQDLYPDYYPHERGSKPGGRTLDPLPYDGGALGEAFDQLRSQHPQTVVMGRYAMTMAEARKVFSNEPGWLKTMAGVILGYWCNLPARLKGRRDRRLVLGNALIGRLRHSMMDRGIPLYLNTAMGELLANSDRVLGVRARRSGKTLEFHARKGVILAAGGFERNQAMREQYLPGPTSAHWSAGNPGNTGDAIQAGLALGAATSLMQHAWWAPAVCVEGEEFSRILFVEKSLPGLIFVNCRGERYTNEAAPYQDYGPSCYGAHSTAARTVPAYAIFDANYRKKFMLGPMMPGKVMPDALLPEAVKNGFYNKADSIAELAEKLRMSADRLGRTLERFNDYARQGEDKDFGRGGNLHDQYYGDKNHAPNPCLGGIAKAPFYAVRIYPGDLGTKGGLLTDEHARVLKDNGEVIEGLYAIGNSSSSVVGTRYPGAGTTLGPAMTFGYLAACHLGAGRGRVATGAETSVARQAAGVDKWS